MRLFRFINICRQYLSFLLVFFVCSQLMAQQNTPSTIIGVGNEYLSAGSFAVSIGQYEEGIRLTELGLQQGSLNMTDTYRASALSNLCAAYAAKGDAVTAIQRCNESIFLVSNNWRAYINRAYSYYSLNELVEARFDLDAANALNPDSRQAVQLRGMINEQAYRPRIIMEDHQ